MKNTIVGFGLALLTFLSAKGAAVEGFIRPQAFYLNPSTPGYSDAGGGGLCGGIFLGPHKEHEISLDVDYTRWDIENAGSGFLLGREHYVAELANYRYHVAGKDAGFENLSFYIGPSVGPIVIIDEDTRDNVHSDVRFSWGGSVGFTYKVARKVDIDVGYRYVKAEAGDSFRLSGLRFSGAAFHADVIYGGVGFRF